MNFDFSNVEVAQENVNNGGKFVEPGFQKLTITGVEETTANSGTSGFELSFESDKGGTFKQKFWILDAQGNVSKAAPSFQYLVDKFTGSPLTGSMNTQAISARLVGKSHDVTVGGRRYTTEKDGKTYNNIAAELPFAGWSGETDIRYSGKFDESIATSNTSSSGDVQNDLPW